MIKCVDHTACSFCLINYADILKQSEVNIINDLNMYDLLDDVSLKSKDVKRIFFHHIIKNVCDVVLSKRTSSRAVLFYNDQEFDLELFNYKDKDLLLKFLRQLTKKIQSMIPLCVYYTQDSFGCFQNKNRYSGLLKEKCSVIEQLITDHDTTRYNFAKVKRFAIENELTYLSEVYFYSMKTKNLMFA